MTEKFIPGIYSADAKGIGGEVTVQVTVDNKQIKDLNFDVHTESFDIGRKAAPIIRQEILKRQTTNVDAVSGATVTSTALKNATQAALTIARNGHKAFNNLFSSLIGTSSGVTVEVFVRDGRIIQLHVIANQRQSLADQKTERVITQKIVAAQSLSIQADADGQAKETAKAIVKATAAALKAAGANLSEWFDQDDVNFNEIED